jgi:Sulfotransferase family
VDSGAPPATPSRPGRPRSVLVTGMPRSGTTWLARELAHAHGAGLPGREPMNPRPGQFALGGTLAGWARLERPTPAQIRTLHRCYAGLEPRTYSRYGLRRWLAPWPWTTTIVKDPFALLSVPAVVAHTGAVPVVLYRHPGAVLASYRRMGWTADLSEAYHLQGRTQVEPAADDVEAMAEFWGFLYSGVLGWLDRVPGTILVSHAELTSGGRLAVSRVMRAAGLSPRAAGPSPADRASSPGVKEGQLHGFAREASDVIEGWRTRLLPADVERMDRAAGVVWEELQRNRLALS